MKNEYVNIGAAALLALFAAVTRSATAEFDETLASNVFARVQAIFAGDSCDSQRMLRRVKAGGFDQELMSPEFLSLCAFVSNDCQRIVSDWCVYETNDMVRFTTASAIAFSGYDNMTNFAHKVLSLYETNTNACSWATVKFALYPYGTKSNAHYLGLNYDRPGVSNIVERMRASAMTRGDLPMIEVCDDVLSGKRKRDCEDMMAIGDWWSN